MGTWGRRGGATHSQPHPIRTRQCKSVARPQVEALDFLFRNGGGTVGQVALKFALTPPIELSLYAGVDGAAGEMLAQVEYFRDNITPFDVEPAGKLATTWGRLRTR